MLRGLKNRVLEGFEMGLTQGVPAVVPVWVGRARGVGAA